MRRKLHSTFFRSERLSRHVQYQTCYTVLHIPVPYIFAVTIYYIDASVLLENTPLVKIHTKLHPGLKRRIFHILTSENIDDFTDINLVS